MFTISLLLFTLREIFPLNQKTTAHPLFGFGVTLLKKPGRQMWMEERQRVAERRRNWDRHRGDGTSQQRHWQERGNVSQAAKGICQFEDGRRQQSEEPGGNLSSSFKWPIDHSSRPFLQSNVDVQISQECEQRGGPATRDSGQLDYDLQLRQSTSQGSRQNSGVQCQSRRRKDEIRYRVQGKVNRETDADTADRKYAEKKLSHVVPHICRRPH